MSTSTFLIKDLKNSLWYIRHERFHEVIWNVPPGGKQSLAENIHSLKLHSIFINVHCHPSKRFCIGFNSGEDAGWSTRRMLLALRRSFDLRAAWIEALSYWKIQSSPHKRAPSVKSDDRSNMPMYLAAFWRPCTTCSSIVLLYENAPDNMTEPPPLSRWKYLVGYNLHANTAETIRPSMLHFLCSTSQHPMSDEFWQISIW